MLKFSEKGFAHVGIIAVFLLIAAIGIGTYLVQQRTNILPKAQEFFSNSSEVKYLHDEEVISHFELGKSQDSTGVPASEQIANTLSLSSLTPAEKPNIIFIVADDQNFRHLSIAGNSVLKTPNIDALADPGVYFNNAYVPFGACSPSRASIWTGKLPEIHGVRWNGLILPVDQITLPEILKANGYNTGFFGKCHLGDGYDPIGYKRGFDYTLNITPDIGSVDNWYSYDLLRNGKKEHHTEYITDYLTDQSINFIKEKADEARNTQKPFFVWLAHVAPHVPNTPPTGSNRISLDQITLPPSSTDDLSTKPPAQAVDRIHRNYVSWGPTVIKNRTKDAYEVISNLDDNVGKMNKTLTDLGIKQNTIVIYISDNGWFFGEHQLIGKDNFLYDEQVKTPILFSYPKLIPQPKTSNELVSSMDLLPTLLNILNIPNPPNIQGISILGLLTGQSSTSPHKSLYFTNPKTGTGACAWPGYYGVVMDGFKWTHLLEGQASLNTTWNSCNPTPFITHDGFDYELYDLKNDPLEMNNLMKRLGPNDNPQERMLQDPTYGEIVQKLRKERAIWATNTNVGPRFILTDGKVAALSPTSLEVSWKVEAGNPTAEIEYQEKDCASCPVMQLDDFNHNPRPLKYNLTNLKPNTTYKIRIFSFGVRGVGGYIDLEGTTLDSIQPTPTPSVDSGCFSDSQCQSGQTCQQICTASYPAICKSVCQSAPLSSASPAAPGQTTGSPPQEFTTADLNQDGRVDTSDFALFVQDYRSGNLRSDLNNDGKVDISDFNQFAQLWRSG